MNVIVFKFKEVLFSVMPIIVLVLNFSISPFGFTVLARFILGSIFVIFGLTIFLFGVDIGITPLGSLTGTALAKSNNLWIILISGLILGFFISIAEPGLLVLANQVDYVTSGEMSGIAILVVVSLGLAILLSLGFIRIFYNFPLYKLLIILYFFILILSLYSSREFLAIAFDASGSTTGVLAVPFILSLSAGISKMKKEAKASEKDSFGLVAIASTGAIISIMLLNLSSTTTNFSASISSHISQSQSIIDPFFKISPSILRDSFVAIFPIFAIFIILQNISFKLNKRDFRKLLTGFIFTFVGLFIFLIGVNAGFMDVGTILGHNLVLLDNKIYIVGIGFILGAVTIVAEPAVYILTQQIEEVTSGYVKRNAVLFPLVIGVGLAVALSVIRVLIPKVQLWHYLLPGYILCFVLMFFIPKLFIGIAFDAGGVATGPVTATFILAFIQGAANSFENADLIIDGFGMIAMVAMMPIITLEFLGLIFRIKSKKKGVDIKNV